MENINNVIDVLMCGKQLTEIDASQIDEMTKKVEKMSKEVLNRDFSDVNAYSDKPPKNLIEQIDFMISRGQIRYVQIKMIVLNKIRQAFESHIDKAFTMPINERKNCQKKLANILHYWMPKELQCILKVKLDELDANI